MNEKITKLTKSKTGSKMNFNLQTTQGELEKSKNKVNSEFTLDKSISPYEKSDAPNEWTASCVIDVTNLGDLVGGNLTKDASYYFYFLMKSVSNNGGIIFFRAKDDKEIYVKTEFE